LLQPGAFARRPVSHATCRYSKEDEIEITRRCDCRF
jgi:hypothetical protein